MKKPKIYWCGFLDGRPHVCGGRDMYSPDDIFKYVELYLSKKEAKKRFEDVRKVKLVEVK